MNLEGWTEPKKILVILAHPDDPEFFCGAMIARWCALGHEVRYCLLTKGQRGSQDSYISQLEIENTRIKEQQNAADLLGVKQINFLGYIDGELIPDLQLRNEIVEVIRKEKPHIVITSDPQNLFPAENRINHPDHRAAGQAVVDAVFPAAGNPRYLLEKENSHSLEPHQVEELWLTLTNQGNVTIELAEYFEKKLDAIYCHTSQLHESREMMRERIMSRFEPDPVTGKRVFSERFKRIQIPVELT